ncbi:phage tail length tape measure family protein [Duganella sp.]|uniref:phage tail length tape measure family protein n=1 Tax=Duganella sp. TaxID=1904440 RepID=UPI0031E3D192
MNDQIGAASIALAIDSSGVDAGLERAEARVQRTGRTLQTLGRTGATAMDGISSAANEAATNLDRATQRQARSIQTLTAELQSGGRATREFQEAMARNRGGEAAVAALRPYLDELDRVREAQNAAAQASLRNGAAFQNNAQSAAQLTASLRQVPAQLTDIVTSLQAGQQPLSVLLQQGGQLRDMFGSVGGAARGLGGYIVSLVTPVTALAAGTAILALAYNQGSKESDAFRKSIILTGNAAGVTTSQLAAAAKQASAVSGTVGENASAIVQLVSTGKVGADQLARFSATAIQSQKLLGISIEDTVKAYADLGKDPLQATLKLNEQYNYLTLATYKQIKALEEQGRTADAAKVAQTAYYDAQESNNKKAAAGLGTLEKAWNATGNAAKKAWDAMLNVGRETTIEEKIKQAEQALRDAKFKQLGFIGTSSEKQAAVDEAQRQLDRLRNQKKVGELAAQYAAEDKKSRDAALEFDRQEEQYLSRIEKLRREIGNAVRLGNQSAQRGEDPAAVEQRIQTRIREIRQANADFFNQSIEAQIAAIKRLGDAQEEQARRAFVPLQANQDAGLNKALDQQVRFVEAKSAADEKQLQLQKAYLQQQLTLTAQEAVSIDGQFEREQKLADLRAAIALKDQQILTRRKQSAAELFVLDVTNTRQAIEAYNSLFDSRQADLEALRSQIKVQQDENEAIGLNAEQLNILKVRRAEEAAAALDSKAAILETIVGREEEAEVLRRTAQAMRDLASEQALGDNKRQFYSQYDDLFNSINQAAKSTFTSMEGGFTSVFKKADDALKSGVLATLYDLTAQPLLINIKAKLTGQQMTPQQLAVQQFYDATGYKSSGAGPISDVSNALGIYRLTSSAGSAVAAAGNLFGSSAVAAFGQGLAGGSAVADAAAAYAAAGEGTIASALTAGSTIGSIVSTALPYVAAAVVAYKAWGALFDDGPESDTRLTFASNNAAGNISINERGNEGKSDAYIAGAATKSSFGTFGVSSTFWAPAESKTVQDFVKTVGLADDALAKYLTATEKATVTSFLTGKTSTAHVGAEGQINSENAGAALAQVFNERIKNILEGVEPGLAKLAEGFQGTSAQLATEAENLLAFRAALRDSGDTVFGVKVTLQDIAALKQPTEAASVALKRVTAEFQATNSLAGVLGRNAGDAFGALGLSSEEARRNIITLVGGIDELTSQTSFFAQNFLTEAERLAPVTDALNKAFASLGITAIPETRAQFAQLVKSFDPATESGQKMIASLLDLEEAFAQTHQELDTTTNTLNQQKQQRQLEIQLMDALGQSEQSLAAQRADALAALTTDQAKLTQAQIYAAQDAKKALDSLFSVAGDALSRLTASVNAEKQRLNDAYNQQANAIRDATQAQVESAQASLSAAQTQASAIEAVFSTLNSALASTKIESEAANRARRQAAQAALGAALANPKGLADNKSVAEAVATLTGQSNSRFFGTFEDYARDQARTNNVLAQLRDEAGGQVDYAKQTVENLQEAIKAIQKSGEKQLEALQKNNEQQLGVLDQQLASETAQLDALKGINNSVLSVKDAISQFAAAIAAIQAAPAPTVASVTPSVKTESIESLYENLLGRPGDVVGLKFWNEAMANGASLDDIAAQIKLSDEYKKLHSFDVGTNRVPYNMLANIHEDERIIPAADNRQLMALMARATDPAQNGAVLSNEVARLRGVVESQQQLLEAIAANTGISAGALSAAQGGRPLNVKVKD